MPKYNPRYVCFANREGRTVEEQRSVDRASSHGAAFMAFVGDEKRAYLVSIGLSNAYWLYPIEDHKAFTAFMQERNPCA